MDIYRTTLKVDFIKYTLGYVDALFHMWNVKF